MTTPTASDDAYPGRDYSLPRLLYAVKRKLQRAAFGGKVATAVNQVEVDALERDALEVLCLVRSVKNSFAPINRIPPEVFSLIPDYYGEEGGDGTDEDLIALTHVCRGWRDMFTSRSSLWVRLDFKNVDKTGTYIQRSQSSPLKLYLGVSKFTNDAFTLVIPHIRRTKSLAIYGNALPSVLRHFFCHAPLLEKLDIGIRDATEPVFDDALFDGDLSSLRELRLNRVRTHLPWKNLANLRIVYLCLSHRLETTQMLDFFESAPFLHTVLLSYSVPPSSDAPPERVVALHHLRHLRLSTTHRCRGPHSALLHHLRIPPGASLISGFYFDGDESPPLEWLPQRSTNLSNLSDVTTINLRFSWGTKFALFSGPSGSLRVFALRGGLGESSSCILDHRILHSLSPPILSTVRRLTISDYAHPRPDGVGECPISQTLSSTNNLRTLILIDCRNLPFILALDPEQNQSGLVLCPNMEELVLCTKFQTQFHAKGVINMAKNRASRGAKLSSITFVGVGKPAPEKEVLKLREHVTRVEYRVDDALPPWDDVPGEGGGEGSGFR